MPRRVHAGTAAWLLGATVVTFTLATAALATPRGGPRASIAEGRQVFRHDTFGDEAFWTGVLRLHEPIATLSPVQALGAGLKVDLDALPRETVDALRAGQVDLDDPRVTLDLLARDAVVGVKAKVEDGALRSVGITCALCHSTVDDALAPGVGHRLDGWPNRDLDVAAIVSLSPNLQPVADLLGVDVPSLRSVLAAWGPGKFVEYLKSL